MPSRPEIYRATNEHGTAIRELLSSPRDRTLYDFDWSDVGDNWLLAVMDERIVGCIQVLPGKPFGRIEHLGIDSDLSHTQRALVTKMLLQQSYLTLRLSGSQVAMGFVPHHLKSYKNVLKKRGGRVISTGNFMAQRLR